MREAGLLILGAALGFISQWLFYRYQRRDEQRQGPMIVVSKVQQGEKLLAELRNVGTDTLTEMDVIFSWLDRGTRREVVVLDYFRGQEGPQRLEVIGSGEEVRAVGLPAVADDGIVDVKVTGLGTKSQHLYSSVSQIAVSLPKA